MKVLVIVLLFAIALAGCEMQAHLESKPNEEIHKLQAYAEANNLDWKITRDLDGMVCAFVNRDKPYYFEVACWETVHGAVERILIKVKGETVIASGRAARAPEPREEKR